MISPPTFEAEAVYLEFPVVKRVKPRLGKPESGWEDIPVPQQCSAGRCVYGILKCEEKWDPEASPASLSCFCPEQMPLGRSLE